MNAPTSSRTSVGEWVQTILLGANLVWTTLGLGGYRPDVALVTYGLSCAAVGVLAVRGARGAGAGLKGHPAGMWWLVFLAYAAVNVVAVSPVPWLGGSDLLGWANFVVTFVVVQHGIRSAATRRALWIVLVGLGLVGVLLACGQRFLAPDWLMLGRQQAPQFVGRASGSFGIPNSLAGYLLLLLPAVGGLALQRGTTAVARVWWGWVGVVLGLGLLLTLSRGAWLALALALLAWPFMRADWKWKRQWGAALGAVVLLTAATVGIYRTMPSARERLDRLVRDTGELSRPILWRAGANLLAEQPLWGTGAGSYGVRFESYRPPGFIDAPQWTHNDYLNTASDYGLIGLGLWLGGVVAWAAAFRRAAFDPESRERGGVDARAFRIAVGVGGLAFALHLTVEFHLKVPALAMTWAVILALAAGRNSRTDQRVDVAVPGRLARSAGWGLAGASVLAAIGIGRFQLAEAQRYRARETIDRWIGASANAAAADALERAEKQLRRAVELSPRNGSAWGDLAFAAQFRGFVTPEAAPGLGFVSEQAARRALSLSAVVPEFWMRLGVALDMQGRRGEADTAFRRALQLAPNDRNGWYYYAAHLALDAKDREAARQAVAKCLSLDPGNRAAEALRARLNPRPQGD